MFAPWIKFYVQDEASDTGSGNGGGGDVDLKVDIDAASDAIGADLGLNEGEGTDVFLDGSATPPKKDESKPEGETKAAPPNEEPAAKAAREAREKATAATEKATKVAAARAALTAKGTDLTGKTDDQLLALVAPQPKSAPKSWKTEQHATWSKLPPEAQAYIEQREAEVEAGFRQYGETAAYGKSLKDVLDPYQPMFAAQGIQNHAQAVQFLMNAHYTLSTSDDAGRAAYMAKLAKSYKVDPAKVVEAYNATTPQMTESEKALQARINALEADRNREKSASFEAIKAESEAEVAAFAADPAHPYFAEVAHQVVLLMNDPKVNLSKAYEMAVYANPVTREKELARLRTEAETKTRTEAEAAAKAAEKARGTRIKGDEKERTSPDLLGSMDDTLHDTMKLIKNRQE